MYWSLIILNIGKVTNVEIVNNLRWHKKKLLIHELIITDNGQESISPLIKLFCKEIFGWNLFSHIFFTRPLWPQSEENKFVNFNSEKKKEISRFLSGMKPQARRICAIDLRNPIPIPIGKDSFVSCSCIWTPDSQEVFQYQYSHRHPTSKYQSPDAYGYGLGVPVS